MSAVRSSDSDPTPPIRLSIPADFRFLRLARATAAAIAADLDFSMQDIDDVRVAVDELGALLIEDAAPGAELEICFDTGGTGISAEGHLTGGSHEQPRLHPVAAELLGLVVDGYDVSVDRSNGRTFRFWKQPEDDGE
jgi:hypothetical protein